MITTKTATTKTATVIGSVLGVLALFSSQTARADMTYYVNQTGGIDVDNLIIDFTAPSIPLGSSGVTNGLKSWVLQLQTNSNQAQCFDLSTAGDGTGDTEFWVYDSSIGDYRSLNDDSNGTYYSAARAWIVPNLDTYESLNILVTSYSSWYNAMQFELIVHKLPTSTTESQCAQGPTVKDIRGTVTF